MLLSFFERIDVDANINIKGKPGNVKWQNKESLKE